MPSFTVAMRDEKVAMRDEKVAMPDEEVVMPDEEVVMPDSIRHPVFASPGFRIKSAMTCMDLPKNKP